MKMKAALALFLSFGTVHFSEGLESCPKVSSNQTGICVLGCSKDSDCKSHLKCCSNGCGHVCTQPVSVPCNGRRPLINQTTGLDLYCGRGGQRCPNGFYCDIHPTDQYAKCCPNTDQGPCDGNKPLTNSTTGQDLYCGRGGQRCPRGSYCDIHPTDKYAKCCPNTAATALLGNRWSVLNLAYPIVLLLWSFAF